MLHIISIIMATGYSFKNSGTFNYSKDLIEVKKDLN